MVELALSSYPAEMALALRNRWKAEGHPVESLPCDEALAVLLDRMYQASLMREEGESVKCRIIVASPSEFARESEVEPHDLIVLRFVQPIAFTPHDLRKLAAAAGYYRALFAVEAGADTPPVIWGIVITGTKWVNRFGGDRYDETPLPPNLVIQILSAGHLTMYSGYTRIFESSGGRLLSEGLDPFHSNWFSQRFNPLRSSLLAELKSTSSDLGSSQICDFFVRDVAQTVIRRVLNLVKTRGHGGTLIFLAGDPDARVADQWFRFRVRFNDDDSGLWFGKLIIRLIKRVLEVGGQLGLPICKWSDYRKMHDAELLELDDALIGFGHVLADAMSVDGALVLDRHFRLLGFGGEILGEGHVLQINRAADLEAENLTIERADSAGTRHRSAYRLVDGIRDSIAVVVSQDGDVRFVAHHRQKLTYWPYLP